MERLRWWVFNESGPLLPPSFKLLIVPSDELTNFPVDAVRPSLNEPSKHLNGISLLLKSQIAEIEMAEESSTTSSRKEWKASGGSPAGFIYFLAVVGAAIYFIQHATTFWGGVLGILKAFVWPAMVMYKVMEMLEM